MRIVEGAPEKLGATWDGQGVNFALFSANGTKVELCLFDDSGAETRLTLPGRTGDIWHGYVPGLKPGQLYGYRVDGPYDPAHGHRFNPAKLLLDPYAREISGEFEWDDSHFGYRKDNPDLPDPRDNAAFMVKARVTAPLPDDHDTPPATPPEDDVIYELNVHGMTMEWPDLPAGVKPGTFAALACDSVVGYLKKLGVTAVELQPVHAHAAEYALARRGLKNLWGYQTLAFFAPDPRFLSEGSAAEFRAMTKKYHDAGIEVILDSVFNHSCEGDETGPTLCFRGIDNASYYRLDPNDKRKYVDWTGCHNTLNIENPAVRRLVLDARRYWKETMHADGYRDDLAPVLGREDPAFSPAAPFFKETEKDPALSGLKHKIAEPWDLGPDGYQLGNFPPGWREWNDRFRDTVRSFWRGDDGQTGRLAERLAGSRAEMGGKGNAPQVSINFITAHDGFTLRDLVSYNQKHNEANGEDNRDGNDLNFSGNCGAEGPTADAVVNDLRRRQMRNMLATLFLAQGTPMMLAGDEFGNSQGGNNNAYCQDNQTGWVAWDKKDAEGQGQTDFIAALAALRKDFPALRAREFLNGFNRDAHGVPDIAWFSPRGVRQTAADWETPWAKCFGMMLNNGARGPQQQGSADNRRLFVVFNAAANAVPVVLPRLKGGEGGFRRILDTADPDLRPGADPAVYKAGDAYNVPPRSVTVFVQDPAPLPG